MSGWGHWEPWDSAGGSSEVRPESTVVASDLAVADMDFLECHVSFLPLKPPIFQCAVGHVLCSPCRDKLMDAGKCHLCGLAMDGGYQRCHAMERAVDSIRVPCPNAIYGCDARPAYHARDEHLRKCPHGACHCPGEACGFIGSTAALLDHAASAHGWPCVRGTKPPFRGSDWSSSCVLLRDGFNFFVSAGEHGRKHLLLLNVVRHPFGRAVSVICIRRRTAADKEIKFTLEYQWSDRSDPLLKHEQRTDFRVACSNLSDGLPDPSESYQLNVPNCVHGDDTMLKVHFF